MKKFTVKLPSALEVWQGMRKEAVPANRTHRKVNDYKRRPKHRQDWRDAAE